MAGNKSTGAVFFRAVVMLAFLAMIPILALSGNSLPDAIRKAMENYLPGLLGNNKPEKTAEGLTEAPPFTGAKPAIGQPASVYTAAVPGPSPAAVIPPENSDPGVVPAKFQMPVESRPLPAGGVVAGSEGAFQKIQNRLKSLGATYYLLETWGNDQRMYRFYCEMSMAGDADFTRSFEATHSDPIGAMQKVLTQVEDWRAGVK
jgi:hypothetical protein